MKKTLLAALLGRLATAAVMAAAALPHASLAGERRSVAVQHGIASYYGSQFDGRLTASGIRFRSSSNMAAHKTLPLGTVVRVTNMANGRSATVRIEDRGPFVQGRIIDLTPRTARLLGVGNRGLMQVAVAPIKFPKHKG